MNNVSMSWSPVSFKDERDFAGQRHDGKGERRVLMIKGLGADRFLHTGYQL